MGYGAPRLLEVKMASKIDFEANWGGFGGHVGPEIGKFGPSMASRWHLSLGNLLRAGECCARPKIGGWNL